ncbi:MAG TPA: glycosyltransferase family A protein [Pyrinomonadaceae bacterium]|nr:glycosyltransferase family A protein [Pyrinomonadaceae bacterium]
MPKYSLVVPTLNRAHLLEGTLESLAKLDHDSYEVIVSNNSSVDETEAVAKRWVETNPRFKYVRTKERLCMSDHWDFALGFVTGEYFIYVGDDDSFDRNILKALDHYIEGDGAEGVYWRQALYYHPSWFEEYCAGHFYILPYTGRKWVIEAEEAIRQMFNLDFPKTFPIGTSFCFKTSIVRSIIEECGLFFARPYPDYTSTMMYLPSIKRYLYVDMALSVIGKSSDSNAAAVMNGPKERLQQFVTEHNGQVYPHVPLSYHVIFNGIAESVRAVQSLRSKELSNYDFNWLQYFRGIYNATRIEKEILESERGRHEYWGALLKMPLKVQLRVITYVLGVKAALLRRSIKNGVSGNGQKPATVSGDNIYNADLCKRLLSLTECSQELSEHNLRLGYF